MIFYVTFLRALGAVLITNAHYVGVYPTDLIANGGLLGDVIFFAVSGFCLYNVKDGFFKWYGKRIYRIYPVVWIITIVYLLIGFYNLNDMNLFQYMIYPTYYHFIASIMVLYILYYILIKYIKVSRLYIVAILTFVAQIVIYIFGYDKSYYHIDTVREYMIRFLFFEAMLIGIVFRQKLDKYLNNNKWQNWIITAILAILYFGSKIMLSKNILVQFQIVNQMILLALLFYIFKSFAGINNKLEKINHRVKKVILCISQLTLEIYIVQYPIIPLFKDIIFPLNWIIISGTIIALAYILNFIKKRLMSLFEKGEEKSEHTTNRSI